MNPLYIAWAAFSVGVLVVVGVVFCIASPTVLPTGFATPPDKHEYILAAATAVQQPIGSLLTWAAGLFAVVGLAVKDGLAPTAKLLPARIVLVVIFLVLSILSIYFGYQASTGVVKHLSIGTFNVGLIDKLVVLQASLLLGAGVAAIILLWIIAFHRSV